MGDIDNAASLRFQLADDAEQRFRFGISERIRGFIHNDDSGFEAQYLGDFDHLLIADREFAHQPVAFEAQVKSGKQNIRFGIHLFPVDFAKAIYKLTPQKDILGNRELWDQVQFLVNDADPGFLRGFWAIEGRFFTQPQ